MFSEITFDEFNDIGRAGHYKAFSGGDMYGGGHYTDYGDYRGGAIRFEQKADGSKHWYKWISSAELANA